MILYIKIKLLFIKPIKKRPVGPTTVYVWDFSSGTMMMP